MLSRNRDEVETAIAELASEWKTGVDAANEIQWEDSAAACFLRLVVAAVDTYRAPCRLLSVYGLRAGQVQEGHLV
jgi:hypothetical protein